MKYSSCCMSSQERSVRCHRHPPPVERSEYSLLRLLSKMLPQGWCPPGPAEGRWRWLGTRCCALDSAARLGWKATAMDPLRLPDDELWLRPRVPRPASTDTALGSKELRKVIDPKMEERARGLWMGPMDPATLLGGEMDIDGEGDRDSRRASEGRRAGEGEPLDGRVEETEPVGCCGHDEGQVVIRGTSHHVLTRKQPWM